MLRVYLDESGTDNSPVCLVAGWMGSESDWLEMADGWMIARKGKPIHLKAMRLGSITGRRRNAGRLREAAGVLNHSKLKQVCGIVKGAHKFENICRGKILPRMAKPYYLAMTICLGKILQAISKDDEIALYFERQKEYEWVFPYVENAIFDQNDDRVKSVTVVAKDACVYFETADYFAWALHEHELDQASEKAKITAPILQQGECIGEAWDESRIRKWAAEMFANMPATLSI